MQKINFNEGWKVYKRTDLTTIKSVSLPHDAMIFESRTLESLGGKNIGWYESNDYVYEKTFSLPLSDQGKSIVFEFEGVYRNAEVYVNGKKVAYRPYGYTNFFVDVTKEILFDKENKIEVYAFNSEQPNSRWYSGTGIYRPVSLYILPKAHIEVNGLKIRTIDFTKRIVEVNIITNVPGKIQIEILDNNKVIKKADIETDGNATVSLSLDKAKLWNANQPYLYTCRATFETDIQETKFGIRNISVGADTGLLVNGERTILYGACIHHDNGLLGAVAHPYAEYRKVKFIKEAGYNAIRSAHNPCSKALLDACDELGVYVLDEYVDMWYIHKTKYDYASYVDEWWKADLKDMVDKDYNHPSVIMYSTGNEVSETAQEKGIKLTKDMTEFLHALDDRPVTCGVNIFFNFLSQLGFGVYSDKKANHSAKQKKHKAVGSEFFNNLAGIFGDKFMKWGASLRGSDKHTYKGFANMDVAGYNYGILRYKKDVKKYPNRIILGTETFCKDACEFYDLANQHHALIGDFVWAGMDYLGEVGIGSWVYEDQAPDFDYGPGWMTAGSGRIDILGNTGGEALYTKVAFEHIPIGMAVVPVYRHKKKHSPSAWKMSNAIESWSFNGLDGHKTKVEVYAKAYRVDLFLNDKRVATSKKKKNGCTFFFNTTYYPGTLTAISYDHYGKEIARTSLVTADEDTQLSIQIEENQIPVNEKLIYAHICITDAKGNTKVSAQSDIKISVEKGEIIGYGNSCPYNKHGYKTTINETYYGEVMAIIKPVDKGNVIIHAESDFGNCDLVVENN